MFHAPPRSLANANALALPIACLASLLLTATASQAAEQAHAHGLAKLEVAVESNKLSIQLESPLDNMVGFERVPRNDKERLRTQAAIAKLTAAGALFKIDPAAQCKLANVELTSAVLKLGKFTPGDEKSGHADIDGSFEFHCVDASKAAYIDHSLFEFVGLQRLDVQVVTPKGQLKRSLKRPTNRLALTN